ncbi:hypothetical protein GTY54_51715 [Streptomyces sp. SID625]|nr:hypothetical protein [Streptomyces sp. SID625]
MPGSVSRRPWGQRGAATSASLAEHHMPYLGEALLPQRVQVPVRGRGTVGQRTGGAGRARIAEQGEAAGRRSGEDGIVRDTVPPVGPV